MALPFNVLTILNHKHHIMFHIIFITKNIAFITFYNTDLIVANGYCFATTTK